MPGQSLVFSNAPLINCPDLPARTGISAVLAPNLLEDLVVFGRKSGFLWAFDPEDGNLRWSGALVPPAYLAASNGVRRPTANASMWPSRTASMFQRC